MVIVVLSGLVSQLSGNSSQPPGVKDLFFLGMQVACRIAEKVDQEPVLRSIFPRIQPTGVR
jgi:hypothetical protein